MTTVVGIFDDASNLEKAVERLAAAGVDNTVYDESTAAAEQGRAGEIRSVLPPGAIPAAGAVPGGGVVPAAGVVPAGGSGGDIRNSRAPDQQTIVEDFKAKLADYRFSDDVIAAYARTLLHHGKFVLIKTAGDRAEQAVDILRDCGASTVDRHG